MSDIPGPSQPPSPPPSPPPLPLPGYPEELTHPLTYHDYEETGLDLVCDPTRGLPCYCMGQAFHHYPNWVVHQVEKERLDLFYTLMDERRSFRASAAFQWERVDALEKNLELLTQTNDRLRQRIDHQEDRLNRVRVACEVTVEISSGQTTPQRSEHSVNHPSGPGAGVGAGAGPAGPSVPRAAPTEDTRAKKRARIESETEPSEEAGSS